ncbi:MAG TPA: hypothetical protein VG754_12430, partial [Verrucomicrobiae bacterium]|nr:hypothetical protein [Verrucomicrobiae bacterium]
MKRGVIILAFFAGGVLLIGILIALSAGGPRRDLEKTKEMLRREGYKTELAEFNFVTTPEMRARAAAFTPNRTIHSGPGINRLDFMAPVGQDTALVLWQLPELPSHNAEDGWPALRESLDEDRSSLDAAMNAILSGPLKF